MPLSRITDMLQLASTNDRLFPPTLFYNEGWLLRLVLDWFSHHRDIDHPLAFAVGARWYSEALLPSQFFARKRGDDLAEGWTHADGVVGHVVIGDAALADTTLTPNATQLLVIEAKLFSRLSPRVTHAVGYDQAARNAACIAEVLCRGQREPGEFRTLGFFVIAPADQINRGVFANEMSRTSIASQSS